MRSLENKNVLLFIPNGKGIYGSAVSNELERRGAKVIVYDERPPSTLSKVAIRIAKNNSQRIFNKYVSNIIATNKKIDFDYVFVVRGEAFNPISINLLKTAFPNAFFILYLWDSLKLTDTKTIFPFFDLLYSFDSEISL